MQRSCKYKYVTSDCSVICTKAGILQIFDFQEVQIKGLQNKVEFSNCRLPNIHADYHNFFLQIKWNKVKLMCKNLEINYPPTLQRAQGVPPINLGFCIIFTSRRSISRVCRIKWNSGTVDYPTFLQITIII